MKAHLTRRYRFSASHRLQSETMSAEENQRVYGKCNNPHGHGHNYVLEVTVSGPVGAQTGMVCNLADLDGFMNERVLARYSDANLNTLPEFASEVPSTEHLCRHIYSELEKNFRPAKVERIRIEETMMNSFEYAGGRELPH
jgi:6-pyruvoyltetrahydropterin/6-carboxytetrahydropterin synthase